MKATHLEFLMIYAVVLVKNLKMKILFIFWVDVITIYITNTAGLKERKAYFQAKLELGLGFG